MLGSTSQRLRLLYARSRWCCGRRCRSREGALLVLMKKPSCRSLLSRLGVVLSPYAAVLFTRLELIDDGLRMSEPRPARRS